MLASVSGLLEIDIFPPWLGLALTQRKVSGSLFLWSYSNILPIY